MLQNWQLARSVSQAIRLGIQVLVVVFLVVAFGASAFAEKAASPNETIPLRTYQAIRTKNAPHIDGQLTDSAWANAPKSAGFTERRPTPGAKPQLETSLQIIYDSEALYVAIRCADPEPNKIVAPVTRRDRIVEADYVAVEIDSRHDKRGAFTFGVNAAGIKVDGTCFNDNNCSDDWNGVWDAEVAITDSGWQVEYRIPLRLLRFQSGNNLTFGLNVFRGLSRQRAMYYWQYIAPGGSQFVSRFGVLTGLSLKSPPLVTEATSYFAAQLGHSAGSTLALSSPSLRVGVDAKASFLDSFHLSATINPDFGQVEADQVELNLSTYETYLPEKRTFFLEDMDRFEPASSADPTLFYTRRLGRSLPQPTLKDNEILISAPQIQAIYGAGKLVGGNSNGFSFGLLNAFMGPSFSRIKNRQGRIERRIESTWENASLLRMSQDFGENSSSGLMATALATDGAGNAGVASADVSYNTPDKQFNLSGNIYSSALDAQRVLQQDDYIQAAIKRIGPVGYGGSFEMSTLSGGIFQGTLSGSYFSSNLALNDLGYLRRADSAKAGAQLRFRRFKKWWIVQNAELAMAPVLLRNTKNINLGDRIEGAFTLNFTNGWGGGIYGNYIPFRCDDRETRTAGDVVYCKASGAANTAIWLHTDSRKKWFVAAESAGAATQRAVFATATISLEFKPLPQVQFSLSPSYDISNGALAWLATEEHANETQFKFSRRRKDTWDTTLRGIYSFSRDLTLQGYLQAFVVTIDEGEQYLGSLSHQHPTQATLFESELKPVGQASTDGDYTFASLVATVILRWEYLPGSTAYLVYSGSSSKQDSNDAYLGLSRLPSAVSVRGAEQRLMMKLSYRFE